MKRSIFALAVLAVLLWAAAVSADVPEKISFQGVLQDGDGNVVPDGAYSMTFSLYDVPTGGTPLWTEMQVVTTTGGIYDVYLGTVAPLAGLPFDTTYWLEVAVDPDPPLAPRVELATAPYAFRAKYAEAAGDDGDWATNGPDIFRLEGNVGIGLTNPVHPLQIYRDASQLTYIQIGNASTGSGVGDGLRVGLNGLGNGFLYNQGPNGLYLGTDGNNRLSITASGLVGIGTSLPAELLHVNGTTQTNEFRMPTGAADGHVLTSDPGGTGTWQPVAGGIGGSGTPGRIPVFVDNTTLGDSSIHEVPGGVGVSADAFVDGELQVAAPADQPANQTLLSEGRITDVSVLSADGILGRVVNDPGLNGIAYRTGVSGIAEYGVESAGISGRAGYGLQKSFGVYGFAAGLDSETYGVFGEAHGEDLVATLYGVYGRTTGLVSATSYAGYFAGNAHVTGVLSKGGGSFKIDHPLDPANRYLYHSFVESPDMKNVYDGVAKLDASGEAWVELPEWFDSLNRDFRYQLTALDVAAPGLHVADRISANRFRIAGGEPRMEVSWQVTGIRKDAFAEKHRIPIEEEKPPQEIGKYLHPDAFGLPETAGVDYRE